MCINSLKCLSGIASLVLLLVFSGVFSFGDELPYLINYQGRLTDSAGEPVADGTYQLTFSLWRDAVSTSPTDRVWISPGQSVQVTDGLFSYKLGLVESLPPWTFTNDSALWLGIQIEGNSEITPRTRLTSSPYAFKAWQASSAGYADSALYSDTAEYAREGGGSGGWIDDGNFVVLNTDDDSVGIGTSNPSRKLDVRGNVYIEGNITWPAKTSYLSVPPAAFRPTTDTMQYFSGLAVSGDGDFMASLFLPQNADLTKITFYWEDANSTNNGFLYLYSSHFSGFATQLAFISTSGSSGVIDSAYTESITGGSIDNNNYVYVLHFRAFSDVVLYGVKIEYTFTETY